MSTITPEPSIQAKIETYEVRDALVELHGYFRRKRPDKAKDLEKAFSFLYQLNHI